RVALFAPYAVERVTVKTDRAFLWVSYRADGRPTIPIKAGGTFELIAREGQVRIAGWPDGRADRLAQEIQMQISEPESEGIVIVAPSLSPQKFKGRIRITGRRGRLVLIEEVDLENYAAGVVMAEAAETRHGEALKAQAIVSRTFAVKNAPRHAADGYDLCSSTHCQVYKGCVTSKHPAMAVTKVTAGIIWQRRGHPVDAYYSRNSGGKPAWAAKIWPDVPPESQPSVGADYCHGAPPPEGGFRMKRRRSGK